MALAAVGKDSNNCVTRPQLAREADRATGVDELGLAEKPTAGHSASMTQADQRRVADGLDRIGANGHLLRSLNACAGGAHPGNARDCA